MTFLLYIAESSLLTTVLFLAYNYAGYGETWYKWERIWFYVMLTGALVLPLIHIPIPFEATRPTGVPDMSGLLGENLWVTGPAQSPEISSRNLAGVANLILLIYISGVGYKALLIILRLLALRKLYIVGEKRHRGGFTYITSDKIRAHFSFFHLVFMKPVTAGTEDVARIEKHEAIHARQLHSLDLLIFSFYEALTWFNPVNRYLIRSLKEMHEYIVDHELISDGAKAAYSTLLLNTARQNDTRHAKGISAGSETGRRIRHIFSADSIWLRKVKFLIMFPALLVVMSSFSLVRTLTTPPAPRNNTLAPIFIFPVSMPFNVVTPYFVGQRVHEARHNLFYEVSHPEITIMTADHQPVYSPADATISSIDTFDNWGVAELSIRLEHKNGFESLLKGLEAAVVKTGEQVSQGDTVGFTGDHRLYPHFSYRLMFREKPIDPMLFTK